MTADIQECDLQFEQNSNHNVSHKKVDFTYRSATLKIQVTFQINPIA